MMKKAVCAFIAAAITVCQIPSLKSASVLSNEKAPVIYAEDVTLNVTDRVIKLPEVYVYDETDVGLTPEISVTRNDSEYAVYGGRFIADEEGEYSVTYSVTNSSGASAEKTVTLDIVDDKEPIIEAYSDTFVFLQNETSKLPVSIKDFYPVDVKAYIVDGEQKTLLEDTFVFEKALKNAKVEVTATEKRENGLSTTRVFDVSVVNKGFIYGFDDIGMTGAIYWSKAQAGQDTDPEKYQVPAVEQNTDETYVHDTDGKSFKVTIKGKPGMNRHNSWPRIDSSGLNTYNAKNYDYIVAWIYNDSPDYEVLSIYMLLDMSNSTAVNVQAKRGEWTKISLPLDNYNGKTGNKTINNVQFFVNGFETGTIVYYVDDLYFE